MPKYMLLEDWATITYGEQHPPVQTLRRWCREGRIFPQPEKHGRSYYLSPEAQYIDAANTELLQRIRKARNGAKAA